MSEDGRGRNVAAVMEEEEAVLKAPIGEFRSDGKRSFLLKCGEGLDKELVTLGSLYKRVMEIEVNGTDKEIVGEDDDVIIFGVVDNVVRSAEKSIRLDHLRSRSMKES
jgi:hypothetical protein